MSMKKILMAAAAVTALTAGSAGAATISNTTTIAGVDLTTSSGTGSNPFTIANELNVTTAPVAVGKLVISPTTATTIGSGQYVLTYNITGGTFTTTSITTSSLVLTTNDGTLTSGSPTNFALLGASVSGTGTANTILASRVTSVNTVNANTIAFNVTIASGEFLTTSVLTNSLKLGTARASVAIDGSIQTAGGSSVDGGAIASKTVVDYRSGYKFTATASADSTLTLTSGFKKFSSDATNADIATAVGFSVNTPTTDTNDKVYSAFTGSGAGATAAALTDLTSAVFTLTGDVSSFNPTVAGQAVDTGTTNVFTFTSIPTSMTASTPTAKVTLTQKTTPVAGKASAYTLTPVVTMGSGYSAPTFASTALGSVVFEGATFNAAWVGDGTNGITYSIRLGNRTSTAISSVKATLINPIVTGTTGTVASTASCEVGPIPASGELIISSDSLKTCFGAFKRSDVQFVIQAAAGNLTAKMRTVSNGLVSEAPLGFGSVAAGAN